MHILVCLSVRYSNLLLYRPIKSKYRTIGASESEGPLLELINYMLYFFQKVEVKKIILTKVKDFGQLAMVTNVEFYQILDFLVPQG